MSDKRKPWLLWVVAVLLAANLAMTLVDWLADPPDAQANIVEGKNWFTTTADEGRTVYLWHYWTTGEVGPNARGQIRYAGRISAGGQWQGQ
jgi:hypothetical protein